MKWILTFAINAAALLVADYLLSGLYFTSASATILAAVILGLINMLIRPIFTLLSFPLILLTMGLFTLIINTILLKLTSLLVPGFIISSFGTAFLGALIISIISWILNAILLKR